MSAPAYAQLGGPDDKNRELAVGLKAKITFAIVLYATCSSLMLIVNKVAVHFLPAPALVLFFQLVTSAVAVKLFSATGLVVSDALEWAKVKPFLVVSIAFLGALFTNVKTLQYANVETFIVFRSSTPILIAFMDYVFLGRQLPSPRSWMALFTILCGALGYVATDSNFEVKAYSWVCAWFAVFAVDQIYIKHVVDTVKMTSWGRVFYTNFLSIFPVTILGLLMREDVVLQEFAWSWQSVTALAASCACGVGMSYSQFLLRALISATSFTVVGILCKVATVIVNVMVWDKHASGPGLASLMVCLLAGSAYQQAPLRADAEDQK